jgi:thioredoxin reductase (NADPH)
MCWLSRRARLEDKRAQARKSRTALDFQRGFQGESWPDAPTPQAQKCGAEVMIAKGAAELVCEHNAYGVRLDDSVTIPARTVVIATGARYHRPSLANLGQRPS